MRKALALSWPVIMAFVAVASAVPISTAQSVPVAGIGGYDLKSTADQIIPFDYDSTGKLDHLVLYRPGTGIIYIVKKNADGTFVAIPPSGASGIGGYDLKSPLDRIIPFDYDSTGKLDHLVLYRPGTGIIYIVKKNADGTFVAIPPSGASGIGGYDLKSPLDRIIPFDYDSTGKLDHLVLYRPGTGIIYIVKKNADGTFVAIPPSGASGIDGYDLKSTADQIIPFDYDSTGKLDHLVLYRPGTGIIYIVKKNADGTFVAIPPSGASGIGGYDLKSPLDRIIPFDYDSTGKLDHLVLYRPGTGIIYIVKKNADGTFVAIPPSGASGIDGYDLKSTADQIIPFDYDSTGKLDHLVLYRPGTGIIYIVKKNADGTFVAIPPSGASGIGGYDLKSTADQIIPFDYDSTGKLDHLVLYRPGTEIIYIVKKNADGTFAPVYIGFAPPVRGAPPSSQSSKGFDTKCAGVVEFCHNYHVSGGNKIYDGGWYVCGVCFGFDL